VDRRNGAGVTIRVPIFLTDANGDGVPSLTFAGAEIQVSKDQGAFVNMAGAYGAIGAGGYYYQLDASEVGARSSLVKVRKSGTTGFDYLALAVEPVGITQSETTAAKRRLPVLLVDTRGNRISGATFAGAEVQISKNGAAWVNGAGAVHEIGDGDYYYEATAGEVDTIGFLMLKIAKAGTTVFVYSETVGKSTTLAAVNFVPSESVTPGSAGGFSMSFKTARITPIEFDLTGVDPTKAVMITVAYANRNEAYTAREADNVMRWPFDVEPDNSIGDLSSEPVHVTMLPRGGWPPCDVEIKVSQGSMAVS
jgi:hypothetical protein